MLVVSDSGLSNRVRSCSVMFRKVRDALHGRCRISGNCTALNHSINSIYVACIRFLVIELWSTRHAMLAPDKHRTRADRSIPESLALTFCGAGCALLLDIHNIHLQRAQHPCLAIQHLNNTLIPNDCQIQLQQEGINPSSVTFATSQDSWQIDLL